MKKFHKRKALHSLRLGRQKGEMKNNMRKRTVGINIRVTENEKEKLKFLAKKCDMSVSDYLRNRGLGKEISPFPLDEFFRIYKSLTMVLRELDGLSKEQIRSRLEEIRKKILTVYLSENTDNRNSEGAF